MIERAMAWSRYRFLERHAAVLAYYLGMVSLLTLLQQRLEARLGAAYRRTTGRV